MTELIPMYQGIAYSPVTVLTAALSATDTVIEVEGATRVLFPPSPNTATLQLGNDRETIRYGGREENRLTQVTRAFADGDVALDWSKGTQIARWITAGDLNVVQSNIERLNENISSFESSSGAKIDNIKSNIETLIEQVDILKNCDNPYLQKVLGAIRDSIDEIDGRVTELSGKDNIKETFEEIKAELSAINSRMTELDTVSVIQGAIKEVKTKMDEVGNRMTKVEIKMTSDMNLFGMTFGSLVGINLVHGIHNPVQGRLEC